MTTNQRWERHHGDHARYYQVWWEQDLLGDNVLTQAWGRVDSRRGRVGAYRVRVDRRRPGTH